MRRSTDLRASTESPTLPFDVMPVRIDPDLRAAIEARAKAEHTTTSEIIREAIRRFLEVA
jgi:predicted transcriptional regulator